MDYFLETMQKRGFIKDATFELESFPEDTKIVAYIGFDLTAPSLHVGSLIQLMVLRWLKNTGHRPIALLGEATTRIGDPSGKDTARPILSEEDIATNHDGIAAAIRQVIPDIEFATNDDWFDNSSPSFMSFLTKYGPHFSINRMLTFESVKRRLGEKMTLSFLEFCYMLLQSVDFRELHKRVGVNMQIGGSDQWGNIVNGVDLIRRMDGDEVFAITTPLLLDRDGKKMGKSQGKPIWLDAELTSPFDFFQFWRNVDDSDVERYLTLFTEMHPPHINSLCTLDINAAKKLLAWEVTLMVHGKEKAALAKTQSESIFERGEVIATVTRYVVRGSSLVDIIVVTEGANSKSAARRLLAQNGVSVDGIKVDDGFVPEQDFILQVGKKSPIQIVFT